MECRLGVALKGMVRWGEVCLCSLLVMAWRDGGKYVCVVCLLRPGEIGGGEYVLRRWLVYLGRGGHWFVRAVMNSTQSLNT